LNRADPRGTRTGSAPGGWRAARRIAQCGDDVAHRRRGCRRVPGRRRRRIRRRGGRRCRLAGGRVALDQRRGVPAVLVGGHDRVGASSGSAAFAAAAARSASARAVDVVVAPPADRVRHRRNRRRRWTAAPRPGSARRPPAVRGRRRSASASGSAGRVRTVAIPVQHANILPLRPAPQAYRCQRTGRRSPARRSCAHITVRHTQEEELAVTSGSAGLPSPERVTELLAGSSRRRATKIEAVTVDAAGRPAHITVVADGDVPLDLYSIAELSRLASERLDAVDNGAAADILEVTSPGVDCPLTAEKHFRRARGRKVEMHLADGSALTWFTVRLLPGRST